MLRREAVRRLFAANQPVERGITGPDLSEDGQKEPVAGHVVSFAKLDGAAWKLAPEPSFLHG